MSGREDAEAQIAECDLTLGGGYAQGDLAARTRVAQALIDRGRALTGLNRSAEAVVSFEQLLAEYAGSGEADLRERVAHALRGKAAVLVKLGRTDDALAAFDDLVARFQGAGEPELRESVATALGGRAMLLKRAGRHAESAAAAKLVLEKFERDPPSGPVELVARVLLVRASAELVLESRSSSRRGSVTPTTDPSSSTPITTVPPAVLANATMSFNTDFREDRSRLKSTRGPSP
jgi:tetratricopeptide (TPR) repeat protein